MDKIANIPIVRTRGDVICNDVKVGDILYEYDYGCGIKSEVISEPNWDGNGFAWMSKDVKDGRIINYYVSHEHSHYGPNLYTYEAYMGVKF